ncbi:hypothetical protein H0H93_010424, partial [Arthromyces matolae]
GFSEHVKDRHAHPNCNNGCRGFDKAGIEVRTDEVLAVRQAMRKEYIGNTTVIRAIKGLEMGVIEGHPGHGHVAQKVRHVKTQRAVSIAPTKPRSSASKKLKTKTIRFLRCPHTCGHTKPPRNSKHALCANSGYIFDSSGSQFMRHVRNMAVHNESCHEMGCFGDRKDGVAVTKAELMEVMDNLRARYFNGGARDALDNILDENPVIRDNVNRNRPHHSKIRDGDVEEENGSELEEMDVQDERLDSSPEPETTENEKDEMGEDDGDGLMEEERATSAARGHRRKPEGEREYHVHYHWHY